MRARAYSDTGQGYGPISRSFHWSMALLILWQALSVLLRITADETPISDFFWGTHYSVGFTIWWLAILRGSWGLSQLRSRPAHEGPAILRAGATIGHALLYILMIVVPSLAILRAAGGRNGLTVYGIQLVAGRPEPIAALTAPANAAHKLLGFVLLALIAGHIAFALWHGLVRKDGTLRRMTQGTA